MTVNDSQTFGAMVEGVELVSNLITRYAIFEKLYLQTVTRSEAEAEGKKQLAQAILKLYIAVLVYFSKAKRYYSRHTAGSLMCFLIYAPHLTY
jgi:hypothetical protein